MNNRCECGRNLDYPLRVTNHYVICRCGKKHKKKGVANAGK